MNCEVATAVGTAMANPMAARIQTSRMTIHVTAHRWAPRAIRSPISRVRRTNLYAIVAYSPTHAIVRARMANALHSLAKTIS